MSSDARQIPPGYRQPAQARLFGSSSVILFGLAILLMLTTRLIAPPAVAIDAGTTVTFVAESIPLDKPADPAVSVPAMPPPAPAARERSSDAPAPIVVAAPPTGLPGLPPTPASAADTGSVASDESAAPSPIVAVPSAGTPAQRAVPGAAVTVAAGTAAAGTAVTDWRARLLDHLKRYRRYPRQAEAGRQQGTARIAITLRRSGEVRAVELVRGSGYPLLDMEARATARRASPLPAPDAAIPGDPVIVEVPIDFALAR